MSDARAPSPGIDASSPSAPLPLPTRFGPYRVLRLLGRGGMGVVYEARHEALGRTVALKVRSAAAPPDAVALARFLAEANTLARLAHPGIVRVVDVGSADGVPWLAMELIAGESMDLRIERVRAGGGHAGDSLRTMVDLVRQAAEALGCAHAAGVLHRDVKPQNVLVQTDGRAVVIDFGLARAEDAPGLTRTGAIAGTPNYIAPERVRGEPGGPSADVFALGALLYEVATLRPAFAGDDLAAVFHAIVAEEPPDPVRLVPGLPADLVAILGKALEKDPARRYRDGTALADDLGAFLDLRPVAARPTTALTRVRRWCRREPLKASLGAGLVLSLPTLFGVVGYLLTSAGLAVQGAEKQRQDRIERLLAEGLAMVIPRDRDPRHRATLEEVLRLDPLRGEAALGVVYGLIEEHREPEAAFWLATLPAALQEQPGIVRLRGWLAACAAGDDAARSVELGHPTDPLDHLVAIVLASIALDRHGTVDVRAALEIAGRGERLWRRPNVAHLMHWADLAARTANARARRECAAVIEAHFLHLPAMCATLGNVLVGVDEARSLSALRRAVALEPEFPIWHCNLGMSLHRTGARAEAWAELTRAIELQPEYCEAHTEIGVMLYEDGRFPEARAHLEQAVRFKPDRGEAWYNLGCARFQCDDPQGAVRATRKAVELLPDEARAHLNLVKLLGVYGTPEAVELEQKRWQEREARGR